MPFVAENGPIIDQLLTNIAGDLDGILIDARRADTLLSTTEMRENDEQRSNLKVNDSDFPENISLSQRLQSTRDIWFLKVDRQEVNELLRDTNPGNFIVRVTSDSTVENQKLVLSVHIGENILHHYRIEESPDGIYLAESKFVSPTIIHLLERYSTHSYGLETLLKLPTPIWSTASANGLRELNKLGKNFWLTFCPNIQMSCAPPPLPNDVKRRPKPRPINHPRPNESSRHSSIVYDSNTKSEKFSDVQIETNVFRRRSFYDNVNDSKAKVKPVDTDRYSDVTEFSTPWHSDVWFALRVASDSAQMSVDDSEVPDTSAVEYVHPFLNDATSYEEFSDNTKVEQDLAFLCPETLDIPQFNGDGQRSPAWEIYEFVVNMKSDTSTFGRSIIEFLKCTKNSKQTDPYSITRNIRQFMDGMKNYLLHSPEENIRHVIDSYALKLEPGTFLNLNAIYEYTLNELVVNDLKDLVFEKFMNHQQKDIELLREGLKCAKSTSAEQLGLPAQMESRLNDTMMGIIEHFLVNMRKASSPLKKLENLIGALSKIQTLSSIRIDLLNNRSISNVFLSSLIFVFSRLGVYTDEIEINYMWALLQPASTCGESGYYLSTLGSALHVLKYLPYIFGKEAAKEELTDLYSKFEGVLQIAVIDKVRNSFIIKPIPVRPKMTVREATNMLAHRLRISDSNDYGLYAVVRGVEDKLKSHFVLTDIKARIEKYGEEVAFVYKTVSSKCVWPKNFTL